MPQAGVLPHFILENCSHAVLLISANAQVIDVNNETCKLLDYSREELLEMTLENIDPVLANRGSAYAWQQYKLLASKELERVYQKCNKIQVPVTVKVQFFNAGNEEYLCLFVQDTSNEQSEALQIEQGRQEWNYAMDFYDEPIYLLDLKRRVVRANQAFYKLAHAGEAEVIGRHITEIIHPDGEEVPCPVCRAQEELRDAVITMEPEHPDNPAGVPIEVICRIIRNQDDRACGILMTIRDLSRARKVQEKLLQSQAVFENTIEGIMITDLDFNIITVNPAFTNITGYTKEEVIGDKPRVLKAEHYEENYYRELWAALEERGGWQGEIKNQRKSGETYYEWLTISRVEDDKGKPISYICVFSDISRLKQSQSRLEFLAHHDPLTALPNRLLFSARLEHAIERARRNNYQLAVLFMDLDRFKYINDSLGHTIGDKLLCEVARRFKNIIRSEDTVSRLGGDEFVILVEELDDSEKAIVLAEKVRKSLNAPFNIQGYELFVGTSIGISLFPQDGDSVEKLLRNADSAMYRAKDVGRNTCQFYTQELNEHAFEHMLLGGQLRKAIEQEQLCLHYQPQVVLSSGQITGLEALVRWQHPEFGLISPGQFIPLAEEANLMVPLGEWVLRKACSQARLWLDQGIEFGRISVNIAGPQIYQGDLVEVVLSILQETGLPPDYLELEITETFIMEQTRLSVKQLLSLRETGVSLAIDDFGTGYSSLSYLKQLPINKLKIDRSFVNELPDDENDVAIIRAIIALGQSMMFNIIAEGVETEEQRNFLLNEGCTHGQGFLYSKALNADEITAFMSQSLFFTAD